MSHVPVKMETCSTFGSSASTQTATRSSSIVDVVFILSANGPGLTGHGMDDSKLACERPARGPVQPMVRARLRGAIHWVDAVGPGPFTAARKRRRERQRSPFSETARGF
jgi:hypothetical protein